MNINRFKRGFSKTNPEKGLHNLPGAQKSDRSDDNCGTIRVGGTYITRDYDTRGRVFGISAYCIAWLSNGILFASAILSFSKGINIGTPAFIAYLILGLLMHILYVTADGMRNSNAPWARKSIIIFWGGLALLLTIVISIEIITSYL